MDVQFFKLIFSFWLIFEGKICKISAAALMKEPLKCGLDFALTQTVKVEAKNF